MRTAAARAPFLLLAAALALLLAAALALLLAAAPAQAKFDPARRWLTAETPHFTVLFPEGCEAAAARAATIAEDVHERLAPRIGWRPRERTRLILSDDTDAAGGWASPYPYNQMLVTVAAPLGEPGFGTTLWDDWLRLVITHEYAHVLQLDLASRFPLALRSVFGRLYFPNALQPLWLIEGLATLEETELTAGGRGRSPGAEMVLRMAALAGPFPALEELAVFPDAWPAGQVPYLFGESFLRHLAERSGRAGVAEISRVYGGKPLPFFVGSAGREALGADYRDLWREWSEALRARFREQERAVTARGRTRAAALTADGRINLAPAWSPDGARIAWLRDDGVDYPGVWVMDAGGSGRRRVAKSDFSTATSGATLAWSPDGARIYYTKPGFVRGAAVFDDIWAGDAGSGAETRLTRGLRARDPHPSPDGRALALVTAGGGLTRLALLDLAGPLPVASPEGLRYLTEPSADQLAEPRWSPDGGRIAVSVRRADGAKSIRILDREGRTVAEIGSDRALDGAPSWSPDGRTLWFASDRTGIFNLFVWDAATGALRQAANVLGGAFSPAVSPDGRRVAFVEYTAKGYDIMVMDIAADAQGAGFEAPSLPLFQRGRDFASGSPLATAVMDSALEVPLSQRGSEGDSPTGIDPSLPADGLKHEQAESSSAQFRHAIPSRAERDREPTAQGITVGDAASGRVQGGAQRQDPAAHLDAGASQEEPSDQAPEYALAARPYSALDTVGPRLWLPWFATSAESGNLYGLLTGGQDALQRHRWLLSALYGPESGRFMHSLAYAYDGLRPTLSLRSSDLDRTYADLLVTPTGTADYTERERALGVAATLSFPGLASSQALSLGYTWRRLEALSDPPPVPPPPDEAPATGDLGSFRLGWSFSNARRQTFSISPEGGRTLAATLERAQEGLGSNRSFTRASADWAECLPLPARRHVLLARIFAGGSGGDTPPQGAFALGGESPGDVALTLDAPSLPLRGYPPNAFRGDHALLLGLEYRFPLREIGSGGDTAPLFWRRLHGALFVDAGEAWDAGGASAGRLHAGVGAELRLDLTFSYGLPLTLRLGVAWGLDEEGGVYPTLGITMPQGLLGAATPTGRR